MTISEQKKRVVILGVGSAGVSATMVLNKAVKNRKNIELTVIDQKNYHFVMPLVYQAVTGSTSPGNLYFPVRKLLYQGGDKEPVRFVQSAIQNINAEEKTVTTDAGEIYWDYLILALGSTTNFFGMEDIEKNALSFRSLQDGIAIHNHILDCYEQASQTKDEQLRKELLTFIIAGGGPSGVELTASILDLTKHVLVRDYSSLSSYVRVVLVEAQGAILTGLKPRVGELAQKTLQSRGAEVRLNTRISKAWQGGIETADGEAIASRTLIWTAGVKTVPVIQSLPFEKARDGRIIVNEYMEVAGSSGVYAIGDCAYMQQRDGSGPYPPTHQAAIRQGPACAKNVLRAVEGKAQRSFGYKFMGQLVYLGRNVATAQLLGFVFGGIIAGSLRRGAYLSQVVIYLGLSTGIRSKLSTLLDWSFAYFYRRDTARVE